MDTTTVINTEISVDRILALTADKQSLQVKIDSLEREIGSKETLIEKLEEDLELAKEKQPEVRIVTQQRYKDSWGCTNQETSIEYKNLSLVQDDIRKEIDITYKEQIKSLNDEVKSLTKELEGEKEKYDYNSKRLELDYKKYSQDLEFNYMEKRLKAERTLAEKDIQLKDLREILEQVKNDKTASQIAEKRAQEIIDLKLRIGELETTIKEMSSINIFKRIWDSILNGKARVIAQKQLIEKDRLINKIKNYWF